MNKKVYFIPGLGANKSMYSEYVKALPNSEVIEFFPPKNGERLTGYAKRMSEKIDTSKPFVLVGTSLGGILANEMNAFVKPEKTFMISTVASRKELPFFIRLAKYLPLQRLIPGIFAVWFFSFYLWLLQPLIKRTSYGPIHKKVMSMAKTANHRFIDWAKNEVPRWQKTSCPENTIHIHGTRDILFPIRLKNKVDFQLKNGTHAAVLTHYKEVIGFIKSRL